MEITQAFIIWYIVPEVVLAIIFYRHFVAEGRYTIEMVLKAGVLSVTPVLNIATLVIITIMESAEYLKGIKVPAWFTKERPIRKK